MSSGEKDESRGVSESIEAHVFPVRFHDNKVPERVVPEVGRLQLLPKYDHPVQSSRDTDDLRT